MWKKVEKGKMGLWAIIFIYFLYLKFTKGGETSKEKVVPTYFV